ncbi:hypothetical protein GCM10027275_42200 [Rhabdobacter roseus]|uniref:DUF3592 domain-containing protein n=1 Tax=Rhabdobacter roseus TaxID=1655419 RepID=A0A840U1E9_9BACT|nr:DUF3592 domain-containing protein [Rhabdobacter roseus]MBB5286198.1 hypothetical protein [Rhabdobacter roseus]
MQTQEELIFKIVMGVVSVGMTALGGYLLYQGIRILVFHRALRRRGRPVTGRVSGLKTWQSPYGAQVLTPTITYQVQGRTYQLTPKDFTYRTFWVGQQVPLRYLPENPAKSTWHQTPSLGLRWVFLGFLCAVLAVSTLWEVLMIFGG